MKKATTFVAAVILIFTVLSSDQADAQSNEGGNLGIGLMAGSPTGISGKLWLGRSNALHLGLAWSTPGFRWAYYGHGGSNFHLHLDYTRYDYEFIEANVGTLAGYYGIGGRLLMRHRDRHDDRIGVRVPFGLNYEFEDNPLEVFVEIAPILDLAPSTTLNLNSGAGLRYFF